MQFQSAENRALVLRIVLGALPEAIISIAASYFTKSGFPGFLITFFGIQALYLIRWILGSAIEWFVFWFSGKKSLVEVTLSILKTNNFPKPNQIENSAESYFQSVADNEKAGLNARFAAMSILSSKNLITNLGYMQQYLRSNIAQEEAIKKYSDLPDQP